jgi:uncharacterized protein YdeI (BOF family)
VLDFAVSVSDPDPEPIQLSLFDNGALIRTQSFASSNVTWTVQVAGGSAHHYFARAIQSDGNTAYTAPLWTDDTPLPTPVLPTATPHWKKNDLGRATIADAHAAEVDAYVELEACVTVPPRVFSDRYIYIQDHTGGIRVYLPAKIGDFPPFELRDRVGLRGFAQGITAERYVELTELRAIQSLGACAPVQPVRLPAGDITKQVEGSLVEVRGTVADPQAGEFVLRDSSGDALVYIDYTTGIRLPRLGRGQAARVIGVVSRARRQPAIVPRFVSDLDFGGTPTPTRSPFTATPRPTATRFPQGLAVATTARAPSTLAPRATATGTPTQRAFIRPTTAPIESARTIDAHAAAIAGGTATAVASFAFFAIGLVLMMRQARK